jgi:putative oxidoreductase
MNFLNPFKNVSYALLRVLSGLLFAFHGSQIILGFYRIGFPPNFSAPIGSQTWVGGMIELIGGLLVMLGFQTRLAAFLCSGTMAVAYVQFHWHWQFDQNFFPALNQGEPAALFSLIFLVIATHGAGIFSLDKNS